MDRGFFHDLGRRLESEWGRFRENEAEFERVATDVLTRVEPPAAPDPADLLAGVAGSGELPRQDDPNATFGQPPVTLFRSRGFFLGLLFWFDSTTVIHDHAFSGAFRVLAGSSLHVRYEFEIKDEVTKGVRLGDLQMTDAELLRQGDTRAIPSGRDGIHSLFHLEHPSVTLIARTYCDAWSLPQLEYHRPGLALDSFHTDGVLDRRLRALLALRSVDAERSLAVAEDLLPGLSYADGVRLLDKWFARAERGEPFARLIDRFNELYPTSAQMINDVFKWRTREVGLIFRRKMLKDSRHRLFLALLLNLPDVDTRLRLAAQLFPGCEPRQLVVDILEELASPSMRGASGLLIDDDEMAEVRAALLSDSDRATLEQLSSRFQNVDLLERVLG